MLRQKQIRKDKRLVPQSAMSNPQQSMAERFAVAIPRPMQQRVQIILQVDWTQIAERFLPLHKEMHDIRDLVIAVLTKDEQLDWYIDFIKLLLTNYVWGRFSQPLKKRQFCLKLVHPHSNEIVSLHWDNTIRETLTAESIPHNVGLLKLVVYPSMDYTFDRVENRDPAVPSNQHVRR